MTYLELAKRYRGHKSGPLIARVLLKNAKRKGAIARLPLGEDKKVI